MYPPLEIPAAPIPAVTSGQPKDRSTSCRRRCAGAVPSRLKSAPASASWTAT